MSETKGIVLSAPDKTIQAKAKQYKLGCTIDPDLPLAYDRTLFTRPNTGVPWDMVPAAWHFLQRWDAAIPLWRYGVNATDVGDKAERARTQAVVRDLRVLLHSVELLFVRNNENGRALMDAYREELKDSGEPRLAFLRAFYRTKPRLCVLPRSWLAEVAQKRLPPPLPQESPLVQVEIGPGQFVRCRAGNEDQVRKQFERMRSRRGRA